MSNNRNSRSYNTSPLPEKEIFMTFLEPSPRPEISPFTTYSTRTQSPRLLKKPKLQNRTNVSPISSNISAKLEYSQKTNAMLIERNKVLTKEKEILQNKIKNEKIDPKNIFKAQAIKLTSESYLKRIEKKSSENFNKLEEKLKNIKKTLNWINEQAVDIEIKFVKSAILQIINEFKGIEVEIEANSEFLLKESQQKIKFLEEKVKIFANNYSTNENQDAISMLISKNADLSRVICTLERKIEDQKVFFN